MKVYSARRLSTGVSLALLLVVGAFAGTASSQTMGEPENISAGAVDSNSGRTGVIQIAVNRWSTPRERGALVDALETKGPSGLLKAVQDSRPVGTINTPDSVAYDLRYAFQRAGRDGGRDVVLLTDRPISFWEGMNRPRSIDYPFTVIQIHFNADGSGEGKIAVAAKITTKKDMQTIEIENYTTQPIALVDVKSEKKR